ncbi:DNA repair protein RecN [Bartonella tamiae]|uniref:DNA repair protein RecN n=1 Tax=Bartonella tamiae Th239 TaxID=1094558 RepID=J0QT53_9HYPH|nr:DNA repair protein RecN [Bartonella tamiae]EJF89056.1 DNA repair protein RecN [Bartonella tamiae Th239]EJF94694.1 DNA repair protein RecN [Bartonella tamiae Th307]
MLIQLSIRDIVLIERLDISFETGLSVLTGETGAGKSILLDSLSLALGGRGDASLVRNGAENGEVRAVFDLSINHPIRAIMREHGLHDEGDIIFRRIQAKDGRSRVFINDQAASVALMRMLGSKLVEIHGQHDDRALVDIDTHRNLLDAFGGLEQKVETVQNCFKRLKTLETELTSQRTKIEERAKEADYLLTAIEELDTLNPQLGEEEQLAIRRSEMMKSEKIAGDIHEAEEILSGADSPVFLISNLVRRLERKVQEAEEHIAPIVQSMDNALEALAQAQDHIQDAVRSLDFDPHELERVEERLFALRASARKHHVMVDDLSTLREKMRNELNALEQGQTALTQLENDVKVASKEYDEAAIDLSQSRHTVGKELAENVMAELPALKLERADFMVRIETDPLNRHIYGIDKVEYWVRTNPGTHAGPILKVASGGELSRFLLALKVALADRGSAPTLIFDEIDTGVGGSVADAIGQRLSRLAKNIQVLSVTHAPQVAAKADNHFLISKKAEQADERLFTQVHEMQWSEREEEIARMLAGEHVTQEARAAAQKLLARH